MTDSVIVSNTPIFDQLREEYAAKGKHYERMVARPVLVNPWPSDNSTRRTPSWAQKDVLPVREPGESLRTTEVQETVFPPKLGDEIVVKHLSDSVMYHGVVTDVQPVDVTYDDIVDAVSKAGVSGDQALEGAKSVATVLTLEKPKEVLLYRSTMKAMDFVNMYVWGESRTPEQYLDEIAQRVQAENPECELTNVMISEAHSFDGTYELKIFGRPKTPDSIGEDQAASLYMKTPNFWGSDEE